MNLVSFQPFSLHLLCLNSDMLLPFSHTADCFSSELTQTRDLSFLPTSSDKLFVGKRKKYIGGGGSLSFYISIFARVAGRQSGMSMCGSVALTDARSQWRLHTVVWRTHIHRLCQCVRWKGNAIYSSDKSRSPRKRKTFYKDTIK